MWHVVVPLKGWDTAKSRLGLSDEARRLVVQAMAADTLAAIARCQTVERVSVLVRDQSLVDSPTLAGADDVVVQPGSAGSLDAALSWFAGSWFTDSQLDAATPLAVVVADLPTLRATSLAEVLRLASQHPSAMVADRHGTGSTILTVWSAALLAPRFGLDSAFAHRAAGAAPISAAPNVTCDVDTADDLSHAITLGLGRSTQALVGRPDIAAWLG